MKSDKLARIDRALELEGLARRHVLTVSQFALAPPIIFAMDYIMIIPRRVGEMSRTRYEQRVVDCLVNLPLQPTRVIASAARQRRREPPDDRHPARGFGARFRPSTGPVSAVP